MEFEYGLIHLSPTAVTCIALFFITVFIKSAVKINSQRTIDITRMYVKEDVKNRFNMENSNIHSIQSLCLLVSCKKRQDRVTKT